MLACIEFVRFGVWIVYVGLVDGCAGLILVWVQLGSGFALVCWWFELIVL